MSIDGHKTLSGGHYRLTQESFNSSLAHFTNMALTRVNSQSHRHVRALAHLARLHAGMRKVDLASPRFTARIEHAQEIVANPDLSPALASADRALLASTLADLLRAIEHHSANEQLLHGEPHPGNVLMTSGGPIFIDFETLCRGPVEFDLAHVPQAACDLYPDVNTALLEVFRHLILAMVAAWRWELGDEFPDGIRWGHRLLRALRDGPHWPTLDVLTT